MSATTRQVLHQSVWAEMGLPALTVLFGLQTFRVLLPGIVYTYGAQPGVSPIDMGIYAFGTFLVVFLAALLRRLLRPRPMLALTAGGVALLRLTEQLSPSPKDDLVLATAGAVLFTLFLPTYLGHVRGGGPEATGRYGIGLLLGLALDTGLHGAFGTYDLSWRPGVGTALLVLVLVLAQLLLLVQVLRQRASPQRSDGGFPSTSPSTGSGERSGHRFATLPALALGPFLFLQMLLFQNVATQTVLSGWPQPAAFTWAVVANVAGLAVAAFVVSRARRGWWPVAVLASVVLAVAVATLQRGGWVGAVLTLLGHLIAASLLALILTALGAWAERQGLWRTTIAVGLGLFIFVLLTFAYYVGYDLPLPFNNAIVPPIAAAILGLCGIGAATVLPKTRLVAAPALTPVGVALALLVLPLASWIGWRTPQPIGGDGFPVRVMTYNLHQGFDPFGRLGMEALAQVIEEGEADIVALQEVSRGWYINGALDMLTWLSRRLDMPYLWGPAADPLWGNGILSRYPVLEHGQGLLPRGGAAMQRGYLWARFDVGGGQELLVIATHLYHIEEEHEVRIPQVTKLIRVWDGRPQAIILGDMNSWPDSPEMDLFRDTGLLDAFAEIGSGDGYTFSSTHPDRRIDYVWFTPDLTVADILIHPSTASDHLALSVTVDRQ